MASTPTPPALVRRATPADLPRILQIERSAATSAHWAEADYEAAFNTAPPLRWLLLAETNRQVEGFLIARSAHSSEWEIENIVVAESSRRAGLATLLLHTFLEQAKNKNPLTIHLEVRESNLPARRLYQKFGFRLDNRRTAYYSHPTEDALLYSLSLQ